MTPLEERLTDDIRTALATALQILERGVSDRGKPCPNIAQLSAIRAQANQAAMWSAELYGVVSVRDTKPVRDTEPRCMCKDRPKSACPGEWEPGCDLGNNPKHVRVVGQARSNIK